MANELDIIRADQLIRQAETATGAFLDALTDEIAIVDSTGTIIAVNEAWRRLAGAQAREVWEAPGLGFNYLDVCEKAASNGVEDARRAADGLRTVLRKTVNHFVMEYDTVTSRQHQWFQLTATALAEMPGALVSHRDITGARRAEEVLRLGGHLDTAGPAVESFLPALVKNLASALHVKNAFLSEIIDIQRRHARLLARWDGTGFGDTRPFYEMTGTPSEQILAGRSCIFPAGVRKVFPDDPILKTLDAEAYIAVPLLDATGVPLGHLGFVDAKPIDDVSFVETTLRVFATQATSELERRHIERRLTEQSRLIYNAPEAIVGSDDAFVITYWNRAAEETYGWTADEVLGRDVRQVLRTDFLKGTRRQAIEAMLTARGFRGEVIHYRKDGSPVSIWATTMPVREHQGRVRGFVSINHDITERKELERALLESERRNSVLLEAIPDMLFTVNARGRILTFTPGRDMQPLVPPEEFLGKTTEEVLPADVAHRLVHAIGISLRTGDIQTVEYRLAKDGVTADYEARLVPMREDEVLGIVRDVTSQKRREREQETRLTGNVVSRTGAKACVLVVDRDMRALRFARKVLEDAGRKALVTSDADDALHLAETERPDVVILDMAVFEDEQANLFGELRRLSDAPVVVMGSADESASGMRAIRTGADDFITKPFSPEELDARVGLALRHHQSARSSSAAPLEFGELIIDPAARMVTVSGRRVALTLTEYRLLLELADAGGRVLTHDEILQRVWGPGYAGQYEVLRAFVRTLRQKVGDDAREPRFVISERGVGYRLAKA